METMPKRRTRAFVTVIVVAVLVILGVIVFGLAVARSGSYTAWETQLLAHVAVARTPALVNISLAVDRVFSPPFAALIGLLAAGIVFVLTRNWVTVVHFALALGFAVFVIVTNSRVRVLIAVLAVLLALGTAATRVYLGVHYPTDAVASLIYAAAAFILIEALWRRFAVAVLSRRPAHAVA